MTSETVLQQILEWSSEQPLWFREELKNVDVNNEISDSIIKSYLHKN